MRRYRQRETQDDHLVRRHPPHRRQPRRRLRRLAPVRQRRQRPAPDRVTNQAHITHKSGKSNIMNGRFVINSARGKLMGVCAGLADWLGIDVLLVRLGMIALTLVSGPVAILFYILTGWLAADDR